MGLHEFRQKWSKVVLDGFNAEPTESGVDRDQRSASHVRTFHCVMIIMSNFSMPTPKMHKTSYGWHLTAFLITSHLPQLKLCKPGKHADTAHSYMGIAEKTYTVEKHAHRKNHRLKFGCLYKQTKWQYVDYRSKIECLCKQKLAMRQLQVKRWPVISPIRAFFDSVCFLSISHICVWYVNIDIPKWLQKA